MLSREVAIRCHGVHDLAAAEAQYHVRCYDAFRKMPVSFLQYLLNMCILKWYSHPYPTYDVYTLKCRSVLVMRQKEPY